MAGPLKPLVGKKDIVRKFNQFFTLCHLHARQWSR